MRRNKGTDETVTQTVSDMPVETVKHVLWSRQRQREYSPIYTIEATLDAISLSNPLLFMSSKLSKYVEAIEGSMPPPDFQRRLANQWITSPPNCQP